MNIQEIDYEWLINALNFQVVDDKIDLHPEIDRLLYHKYRIDFNPMMPEIFEIINNLEPKLIEQHKNFYAFDVQFKFDGKE